MLYYNKDYEMQKIIFDFLENHGLNKEMRKNHIISDIITKQVLENANKNKENFHFKNDKQAVLFSLSAFVLSKKNMTSKEFSIKKHKFDINKNNSYFIIDEKGNFSYTKTEYNKYFDYNYVISSKCIDNISMIGNEDKDFLFSNYKEEYKASINNINSNTEIDESSINKNLNLRQFNKFGLEMAAKRITLVGNKNLNNKNNIGKIIDFNKIVNSKSAKLEYALTEEDIIRGKDLVTNKFYNIDAVCNDLDLNEFMDKIKNKDISTEKSLIYNLLNNKNYIILLSNASSYPDVCPKDKEEVNYENLFHFNSEKNRVYNKMNLAEKKKYRKKIIKYSREKNSSFNRTYKSKKNEERKNIFKIIAQKLKLPKVKNEDEMSDKTDIDYPMQKIKANKKNNDWIYKDKGNTTYNPIIKRKYKDRSNDKINEKGKE